jgi:hypothetical protein
MNTATAKAATTEEQILTLPEIHSLVGLVERCGAEFGRALAAAHTRAERWKGEAVALRRELAELKAVGDLDALRAGLTQAIENGGTLCKQQ